MTPTEILKHEHKIILLVLGAAEREGQSIENTGKVHAEKVEKMIDFFSKFTDKCHHAKEEKLLFMKMQEKGMTGESGPIAVMLSEHNEGRQRLKAIAETLPQAGQGDTQALKKIKDNLMAYSTMLRNHIEKEDNILYPMGDRLFSQEDQQSLSEAFEKVEKEEREKGFMRNTTSLLMNSQRVKIFSSLLTNYFAINQVRLHLL